MGSLPEILTAFESALEFWALHCADADLSSIPPAKTADPLSELVKLAKLIRAHTTKVGIIFEPANLQKQSDAAQTTVTDLSKTFVLFMSALALVSPAKVSQLFYKEILSKSHDLVSNGKSFCTEIASIWDKSQVPATDDQKEKKTEDASAEPTKTDKRLVSVGKLWSTCDDIVKLIEAGNLKFLERKTRMHLTLIEDGLDEFSEWAENPEEIDDDDPFGLDEEYSDTEEVPSLEEDDSDNEQSSENRERLILYSKLWLQKFKLVKLLFLSINKSLPTITVGTDIDDIYSTEATVCKEIDLLIVELMMNQIVDDEVNDHAKAIDKACLRIMAVLKKANKNNDTKTKWCGSWQARYGELLETMYKK